MKGIIIVNRSGFSAQEYQARRIEEELSALGVSTETISDGYRLFGIKDGKCHGFSSGEKPDFAVFLDKDKYLAELLTAYGIRLFNRAEAIKLCDDKGETCIALANSGLKMPDTVFAPLCYKKDEASVKIAKETADYAARRLGFPLVVKESYGSMGTGVMLAENATELEKISLETANKPHLYQQYLSARKGTDVRVIVIGGKVASAMERHNPSDFRSNLALGGTGKEIALSDEFAEAAERAAKILKLDYCGVDLLYGDSGEPYICEVNSNAFFKGTESVTHKNIAKLYAEHVINCINNENNPNNAN